MQHAIKAPRKSDIAKTAALAEAQALIIEAAQAEADIENAARNESLPTSTEPTEPAEAPAIDKAAARHAARLAANALFRAADTAVSIPVKALSAFKAYRVTLGALRCNVPTTRQAAALAVACLQSGQALPVADTDLATFPRGFNHPVTGDACVIENGAAADCVSTGLASYDDKAAAFTISGKQANSIRGLLGKRLADIAKPAPVAA